jgi:hypothetical protein
MALSGEVNAAAVSLFARNQTTTFPAAKDHNYILCKQLGVAIALFSCVRFCKDWCSLSGKEIQQNTLSNLLRMVHFW